LGVPGYGPGEGHYAGNERRARPHRDTHFGFRTVGLDDKQAIVDEVFDKGAAST
jgi:hypothetical protein